MPVEPIPPSVGGLEGWTCPYCDHGVLLAEGNHQHEEISIGLGPVQGSPSVHVTAVVCPRKQCQKLSLQISVTETSLDQRGRSRRAITDFSSLRPRSTATVFSADAGIPPAVLADYEEGCMIVQASPKAAATLFRRALQGMIRDFWGVKGKKSLYEEIKAIQDRVEPEVRQALLDLKEVGNVGAHMEQDVNLVLDIEPLDATRLRKVLELLLADWYVRRRDRACALTELSDVRRRLEDKRKEHGGDAADGNDTVQQ